MVVWSEPARNDLKQIYTYISQESSFYAEKVILTLIEKSEILINFPEMGRIVPEIMNNSIRELIVYSYRMIYEISGTDITVHTVIHAKRDFNEVFHNTGEHEDK
jgi:addiction module RelE/StbE family toxin